MDPPKKRPRPRAAMLDVDSCFARTKEEIEERKKARVVVGWVVDGGGRCNDARIALDAWPLLRH